MNSNVNYSKLLWAGDEDPCLDQIKIDDCEEMVLGRYGGNRHAGAYKNEDGAMLVKGEDWEFAMILDGHNSSESVQLVLKTIDDEFDRLAIILNEPVETAFRSFETSILSIFKSQEFLDACKKVKGETACLLCVRKANYLWWLSIGDCLIYLFYEELHKLGQYVLNQRQFFEWIGEVNTFSLPVPCYSSGIRELRTGNNRILLLTDGVVECGGRYYENANHLYLDCYGHSVKNSVNQVLQFVLKSLGRDSATIISWDYHNQFSCTYPSN
ncbi:protein phosphatase 2C domain-containing protein [Neobacillus mesonae]